MLPYLMGVTHKHSGPSNVVWSTEHYVASSPEQLDALRGEFFLALHWVNTTEIRCKRLSDGAVGNLPCDLLTGLFPAIELRRTTSNRDSERLSIPRLVDPLITPNTDEWNLTKSRHTNDDVYHKRITIHRSATDSKIRLSKNDQDQLPMVTVYIIPADHHSDELKTVNHEQAIDHRNSNDHITIRDEVKLRARDIQGIHSNER
ncbi:hypothetical protein P879_03051 [Paragonimus westermani]|uniref:Uncharacterized protein n=1 Tax=Paragonimus westermani TaxID=34504 RepID=A0A8T0DFR7_9TREM|nr:hypothetical protein P879_03051 [Paragonimus westermani]